MIYLNRTSALAFILNTTLVTSIAFTQTRRERSQSAHESVHNETHGEKTKALTSPKALHDAFSDLQLSLLSVSYDDYLKLTPHLDVPSNTSADSTQVILLNAAQFEPLNAILLKSMAQGTAGRFHSYRMVAPDVDFSFGELPVPFQIPDITKTVAKLKFETDETRDGNRLLAGQFRLHNAPESPVDVEFMLPPDTGPESPIGHMIAIPVQERVWLLTLCTKRPDADSTAVLPGSSDLGKSIIVEASDAIDEVLEVAPNRTVKCAVGASVKLKHSSRIKAVFDFDSSVLNVSPVQGEAECLTVRSLVEGGTQIRIVDEYDAEYLVKVLSLKFSELDIYLKHLFPNEDIEVWPIQGVALLRGTVKSELQKEYVVDVAQQFYPGILNQLSVGSHSTSRPRKTDRPFIIDIDPAASSVVKITAENSSLVISSDHSRTLVFPERIRSVRSLNSEQVKVEPVQGAADSMTIYGRQNGVTKITVTGEDDRRYTVTVVVEHGVQEISLLTGQLYPNLNLSFSFVKSAIVVRGAVETEAQRQQIRDIVGQYAPVVLDQTHLAENMAAADPSDSSESRQPVTDTEGIAEIRSDIKSLHADVRELIQILKARETQKQSDKSPGESAVRQASKSGVAAPAKAQQDRQIPGEQMQFFAPREAASDSTVERASFKSNPVELFFVCDQPGLHAEYLTLVQRVCKETKIENPVLYSSGPYFADNYNVKSSLCILVFGANTLIDTIEGKPDEGELRKHLTTAAKQSAQPAKNVKRSLRRNSSQSGFSRS